MKTPHFKTLIISSKEEITSRFSEWLNAWGYGGVYQISSILLIPERIRTEKLDLILYDPDSSEEPTGVACAKLLRLFIEIPILILETETTTEKELDKALTMGAFDYISKNATEREIRHRIRSTIHVKRILSQEKQVRKELILDNMKLEEQIHQQKKTLKDSIQLLRNHYEQRESIYRNALDERKVKVMESLTEGIAHTFNNLFQVILGHTFLLRSTTNKPVAENNLSIIEAAVTLGAKVIQQLITYNRDHSILQNEIPLNEVIHHHLRFIESLLHPNTTITLHTAPDIPPIKGNRSDIEWVLLNLILNAQDAMPEGGTITVTTCRIPKSQSIKQDWIELWVQDTGTGMDEFTLSRIFDPFFTTKINNEGRGLGLTITQKIVEEHHGKIFVSSTPGEGSVFSVHFPSMIHTNEPLQKNTNPPVFSFFSEMKENHYSIDIQNNQIRARETV